MTTSTAQIRAACRRQRRWIAVPLAAALIAVPGIASGHVSLSYEIAGIELPSTATTAYFVGSAVGENAEDAAWSATIQHTALSPNATITGGTFSLTILHVPETLTGEVAGGSITLASAEPRCGSQTYDVVGTLKNITSDTEDPTLTTSNGAFQAVLTHYRTRIGRSCVTYFATIVGALQLNLTVPEG